MEAITWSFTDSNYNDHFKDKKKIKIVNPISSELGVLRNSIFSNLIMYMNKNLDRGFKDLSIFEIGPIFMDQILVNKIQLFVVYLLEKNQDYLGLKKREMLMYLMLKEM